MGAICPPAGSGGADDDGLVPRVPECLSSYKFTYKEDMCVWCNNHGPDLMHFGARHEKEKSRV